MLSNVCGGPLRSLASVCFFFGLCAFSRKPSPKLQEVDTGQPYPRNGLRDSQRPEVLFDCSPVASLVDALQLSLCYSSTTCRGRLEIVRRTHCRNDTVFSLNPGTLSYVRRFSGPDTFNVRLSGPEVIMADVVHRGQCGYNAVFALSTPGSYSLAAELTYVNYDAFNDKDQRWHPLVNASMLPSNLTITCNHASLHPARASHRGFCSAGDHRARWVKGLEGYTWTPYDCQYTSLSSRNLQRCFEGKRILFVGDSQMRATFIAFLRKLSSALQFDAMAVPPFALHDDTRFSTGSAVIDYLVDPLLYRAAEAFAQRRNRTQDFLRLRKSLSRGGRRWAGTHADKKWAAEQAYDWVVVCIGQHFAAKSHWPFSAFQIAVQGFLELSSGSPILWLTIPAMPPRRDRWVRTQQDWRNSHRFGMMNQWLRVATRSYPTVRMVDYFGPTYPMMRSSLDSAHFHSFPQTAVVEAILHTLC